MNAGDLLREETSWEDSELGKLIEEHMKNGTIVPTEIICKLIKNVNIGKNSQSSVHQYIKSYEFSGNSNQRSSTLFFD